MHEYSYDRITEKLPQDVIGLIGTIHEAMAKEIYRRDTYKKEYSQILSMAKLASVKYSNEIEGIVTTDDRINELILRGGRPLTHSEEEIAGYGSALDMIHGESLNIDINTLNRLHSIIRAGNPMDRGHFKTRDNVIASIDTNGNRHIVMRTVRFQDVEHNINEMLDAYLISDTDGMDPLLLIPCVIVDYLCIHPYTDGNGRTSRLLTYLMLYQHGIDVCKYVSLDEHIASTRDRYYAALNESSIGWDENTNTYVPFIRYFLQMLFECYTDLDTRFAMKGASKMKKNERVELILKESLVPISKRQILMALPDVSYHTVDSVIKRMVQDGQAERVGGYRNARYIYRGER